MELLVALAQHRHFARAAASAGISQPAFSARIRNIEESVGAPLVRRGNRFAGFTAEGEIVLRWARRMLADAEGLRQEMQAARGALSGSIAIGVVPTAVTFAARAPAALRARHPGLTIRLLSRSSDEIARGLEDFTLDAGVTYLDAAPPKLRRIPLYDERYALLVPPALAPRAEGEATWAEAAALPLCLLTRDMQNRRIVDDAFAQAGARPEPVMETNAFVAALAQVAGGTLATVVPETLADALPLARGAVRLSLTAPEVAASIGLVLAPRDPEPPALAALRAAFRDLP